MHHKFPAVSLLCACYSLVKRRVLAVHDLLCPAAGAMDAPIPNLEEVAQSAALLRRLAVWLHTHVLEGNYGSLLSSSERAGWSRVHSEVLSVLFDSFEVRAQFCCLCCS